MQRLVYPAALRGLAKFCYKMKVKSIFVNLPIKDLNKTRDFWTKLGFSFNEQYSDDKALCLVLNEGQIYSMLITHEMFSTFTNRPIADGSTTQVLTAIQVDSREQVDNIVKLALENGGSRYRDSADHGWMYYDSFADPDGHQWEVMFTDTVQITQ
jgi:predicted lactoylglutathione lyase